MIEVVEGKVLFVAGNAMACSVGIPKSPSFRVPEADEAGEFGQSFTPNGIGCMPPCC